MSEEKKSPNKKNESAKPEIIRPSQEGGPSGSQKSDKPQITPEQLQRLLMAQMQSQMQKQNMTKKQAIMMAAFQKAIKYSQATVQWIDRFINYVLKKQDPDRNDVMQTARYPILFGTTVMIIFIGFGGLWSAFAPLDSATVAIGRVTSASQAQQIQSHQGGIIKKIHVKQGQVVKKGDPIIELEEVNAKANYTAALDQYRAYLASEDRLQAERDNLPEIEFEKFLLDDIEDPKVKKIIEIQKKLYAAKKEAVSKHLESLDQQIHQVKSSLEAMRHRLESSKQQEKHLKERLDAMKKLAKGGYASKANLSEVEAKYSEASAQLAAAESEVSRYEKEQSKVEAAKIEYINEQLSRVVHELTEIAMRKNEAHERYLQAKDNFDRVILRSPVDGVVNRIAVTTEGGIAPGSQSLAEVTPNDELIIIANIPNKYIDRVAKGQKAKIKFSAFKSRTSPVFTGTVKYVSPDVMQSREAMAQMSQMYNQTMVGNEYFYEAQIDIDWEEFNRVGGPRGLKLLPGMQAEVQIIIGERTLLQYLLDPLTNQMFKSFIER